MTLADDAIDLIHLTLDGAAPRCGAPMMPGSSLVTWRESTDPLHADYFTCGDCLTAVREEAPQ